MGTASIAGAAGTAQALSIEEKLQVLADAAKYDVACASSGAKRVARPGMVGIASNAGCCHAFAADGRCVTLLKVLMGNDCAYDCTYCASRRSNECVRAQFEPRELAELTIGFYQRNYIEGLFLSSAVLRNPDHTMELMIETLELLRGEYRFNGYIHAKSIPGASPELVHRLGCLADRLSVNIELPSREGLRLLAPQKAVSSIARPMAQIRDGIQEVRDVRALARRQGRRSKARFAPAGQSTQMIVGATPDSDLQVLGLSDALYRRFGLKRVFFSAYLSVNSSPLLPASPNPPLEREHRLYQADWLMRFYHFEAGELVDEAHPFLEADLDPKCAWAIRHLDQFPVEVNAAPYETLLRVPGIGVKGARAIVRARRATRLTASDLKGLGVSLKRARLFITCDGKYDPIAGYALPAGTARRASGRAAWSLLDDPQAMHAAMVSLAPGTNRLGRKKADPNQLSLLDDPAFLGQGPVDVAATEPRSWRQMRRRARDGRQEDDAWALPARSGAAGGQRAGKAKPAGPSRLQPVGVGANRPRP